MAIQGLEKIIANNFQNAFLNRQKLEAERLQQESQFFQKMREQNFLEKFRNAQLAVQQSKEKRAIEEGQRDIGQQEFERGITERETVAKEKTADASMIRAKKSGQESISQKQRRVSSVLKQSDKILTGIGDAQNQISFETENARNKLIKQIDKSEENSTTPPQFKGRNLKYDDQGFFVESKEGSRIFIPDESFSKTSQKIQGIEGRQIDSKVKRSTKNIEKYFVDEHGLSLSNLTKEQFDANISDASEILSPDEQLMLDNWRQLKFIGK